MRELIRSIQRETGITSVFVTHDQEEAVMLADRIALMFDGVLQQYDIPQAFFERPSSAQVAHFFRNDNLLPGRRQGNFVTTEVGSLEVDPDRVTNAGDEVLVTVRPEEVNLGAHADNNTVPARVLAQIYMGTYTQIQVEIANNIWLLHGPADFQTQVGDTISVQLPKSRIWLLPKVER
jgi:ABC-type Fe3+/spermidine/putrescine transport system ATPase subunit